MGTLVPNPLWSCESQPVPGSTHAEHKATLGKALAERVKRMEGAVHQAHDWLSYNPLPWDPILWAHPPDPLNPSSVSHGAFSTSVQMPPRTRPTYQPTPTSPQTGLEETVQARTGHPTHAQKLQAAIQAHISTFLGPCFLSNSTFYSTLTPTATTKAPLMHYCGF